MSLDLLHGLCALAVVFVPLGLAWLVVTCDARRQQRRRRPRRGMR